jgi:hypothetical protein
MIAAASAADPLAHLKQRAQERAQRTVERTRGAIRALQTRGAKVTAEAIELASRELEPGFGGLSFQVIRRNAAAYALYRGAADAFAAPVPEKPSSSRRRRRAGTPAGTRSGRRLPRAAYDPLEGRSKKELVRRIRSLEQDLLAERQRHAALAYDKQTLLARLLRIETENVLLRVEATPPAR